MRTKATLTVRADEVREGDFIPGLDNGYVFEDPAERSVPSWDDGRYSTARPEGYVSIGFHTADGEEGELIVPDNMPITITRE